MTVVLYLAIFIAGGAVGFLAMSIFTTGADPQPIYSSTYQELATSYHDGYNDGQTDANVGIWRGGPLQ